MVSLNQIQSSKNKNTKKIIVPNGKNLGVPLWFLFSNLSEKLFVKFSTFYRWHCLGRTKYVRRPRLLILLIYRVKW